MSQPGLLASLMLLALTPTGAFAQPLGRSHTSVEAIIAPAEFVAFGKLRSVTERVIAHPSATNERGKYEYVLRPDFTEVLKKIGRAGERGEYAEFRTRDPNAGRNERLEQWAKDGTVGLWVIMPRHPREKFHRWQFVPLTEAGVNQFGYKSGWLQPPMFSRDLSILTTPAQIQKRLRQYGPVSQREHDRNRMPVVSILVPHAALGEIKPGDFNQLSLPVDSMLLQTARRLIESPAEFVPPQVAAKDPDTLDTLCMAGIEALGALKSDASIELLRECMDASTLPLRHSRNPVRVRTEAYQQLLTWHVNPPRPEFGSRIRTLTLPDEEVNDETMPLVAELENLETLCLWQAPITHVGVAHLSGLRKLRELQLGDAQVTNEMLRTLARSKQLHLLSNAQTKAWHPRPKSAEEVANLKFWCAPFTDEGVKELTAFRNLQNINLGRMKITDASIEHLASFKKLKFAVLHETEITPEGARRLREALPNCSVEVR